MSFLIVNLVFIKSTSTFICYELSENRGFVFFLQDCRDKEGLNGTWFESTGMKQYSFLTFFWLPILFS